MAVGIARVHGEPYGGTWYNCTKCGGAYTPKGSTAGIPAVYGPPEPGLCDNCHRQAHEEKARQARANVERAASDHRRDWLNSLRCD